MVAPVTLDLPGLEEPASGQLISIPERRVPILNDLHLVRGRYIEPGRRDEVIISHAFAEANGLNPGDALSAVINGRWTELRIVGVALSPEFVYEIRPGDMFPDSRHFGVMWMGREALAAVFDMEGAFNDVSLTLAPGASENEVIARLDSLLADWGGLGAYGCEDQPSNYFITNEIAELKITSTVI
ncbi:MAG TPA: ABC transporter permease, partial [Blastocatellia bacterium]|nr:ABC transporter permease [Blastocatellia bacterium]